MSTEPNNQNDKAPNATTPAKEVKQVEKAPAPAKEAEKKPEPAKPDASKPQATDKAKADPQSKVEKAPAPAKEAEKKPTPAKPDAKQPNKAPETKAADKKPEPKKTEPKKPEPKKTVTPTASTTAENDKQNKKKKLKARPKWLGKLLSSLLFLLLVAVPWGLVINYVTTIAHPRYVSKSGVVVKQVSDTTANTGSGIGALLGVNSTSVEDAKYLTEYILSNDMIKKLDDRFDFQNAYYIDGTDIIYELPEAATQEELLEYFKKRVRIDLDEQTNVLTVTTEGFDPEYALELNKAILSESERFVNRISQQIATDQLQYSQAQLVESQERLDDAKQKLLTYQNKNRVFDPQTNAQMVNQLIGSLQAQLSSLRTEERQLLSYLNPEAPQVVSIRSQIKSVEQQIQVEQSKLTSASNNSKLNEQTIQFEAIKQEVEFATELYKISLSSLEKARLEAFRKMKNLIVISAPYEAEEALYPRVQYIIWTSLAFLLIFYGFIRLVMAVIKDHSS